MSSEENYFRVTYSLGVSRYLGSAIYHRPLFLSPLHFVYSNYSEYCQAINFAAKSIGYAFLRPILYFATSSHSFFSLCGRILTWLIGALGCSTCLSSTILIRSQSYKRTAIVFLRPLSSSEKSVDLPSSANSSLKCTM